MTPTRLDRTLPSLLDRLTGGDGGDADSVGGFVSTTRYLKSVRRDVAWLLRTDAPQPTEMLLPDPEPDAVGYSGAEGSKRCLADFPNASKSVLMYGVPLLRGVQENRLSGKDLAQALERAIKTFEPRIDPVTLRVRLVPPSGNGSEGMMVSVFGFEIEARVRMKPLPEHLVMKASYAPALAQWQIEGLGHGF